MPINLPREFIIAYDIADPKRLGRVHRLLKKLAIPLQYSVFYTRMSDRQKEKLIKLLDTKINPREDDIRIYPLSKNYQALYIGSSPFAQGLQMDWQRGEWSKVLAKTLDQTKTEEQKKT